MDANFVQELSVLTPSYFPKLHYNSTSPFSNLPLLSGFSIKTQCVYLFCRNATCSTQLFKFISLYNSYHQMTWIILRTRKLKRNIPESSWSVNVNRPLPLSLLLQMWHIHLFAAICMAACETVCMAACETIWVMRVPSRVVKQFVFLYIPISI
jgi:hypothetical protein